ncbi:pseudouridine synthase [Sphingomonas sp. Tas61C01]|uniref:pseudouridine synthase n=1 Tax=Sphingomonas sp. Tas61C01 TaxID=3458297 RepID=UPI00403E8B84
MPTDKPDQPTAGTPETRSGDRIAKLLARAGVASRREIERMIVEGRIALDGVVLDTPATIIRSLAGVTVDGEPVEAPQGARLFLHHKPTGLLVTERDPAGRPTIYDRLPADLPRLVPVGRLDLNTEGLLLLTTDGGLKRQLELPATGVERAYRARTYGPITQAQLEELIEGVEIDGIRYGSIDANLERRTGANAWIELVLTEGKNREVRRVLEHLGLQVSRLIRTRYGPFLLGELAPGEIGEVKQNDLVAFRKVLDGPKRGKVAGEQVTVEVEAQKPARNEPRAAPPPRARLPREGSDRPAPRPVRRDDRAPERPAREERATAPAPTPPRAAKPRTGPQGFGVGQRRRQQQAAEAQASPRARRTDDDRTEPRAFAPRSRADKPADRAPPRGPDRSGESPWARPDTGNRPAPVRGAPSRTRSDEGQARAARASGKPSDRTTPRGGDSPRPTRPGKGPAKGPSGGRGHPPRAPKGKR